MMYRTPRDTAAFDMHYFETHVPLAKMLPGLRKYEIVQGPGVLESPEFHLMATFHFDDADAAEWALASPEGLAAAADRTLMAPGADDVVMFLIDGYEMFGDLSPCANPEDCSDHLLS
jgi:uncharacterized protein (TIGR02118 family)